MSHVLILNHYPEPVVTTLPSLEDWWNATSHSTVSLNITPISLKLFCTATSKCSSGIRDHDYTDVLEPGGGKGFLCLFFALCAIVRKVLNSSVLSPRRSRGTRRVGCPPPELGSASPLFCPDANWWGVTSRRYGRHVTTSSATCHKFICRRSCHKFICQVCHLET